MQIAVKHTNQKYTGIPVYFLAAFSVASFMSLAAVFWFSRSAFCFAPSSHVGAFFCAAVFSVAALRVCWRIASGFRVRLGLRVCRCVACEVWRFAFLMLVAFCGRGSFSVFVSSRFSWLWCKASTNPEDATTTHQRRAEQGAAPDRLQPALRLVPRLRSGFRRRVSLVVLLLARNFAESDTFPNRNEKKLWSMIGTSLAPKIGGGTRKKK